MSGPTIDNAYASWRSTATVTPSSSTSTSRRSSTSSTASSMQPEINSTKAVSPLAIFPSSTSSSSSTRSAQHFACAHPSWPAGSAFGRPGGRGSAYVSDEDLSFGLGDLTVREAPAPPRTAAAWLPEPSLITSAGGTDTPRPAAAVDVADSNHHRRRSSAGLPHHNVQFNHAKSSGKRKSTTVKPVLKG